MTPLGLLPTRVIQLLVLVVRSGMPTSLAVLLGFAWHQRVTWPELDAPSRSMLVTPVFLYLARVDVPIFRCYR